MLRRVETPTPERFSDDQLEAAIARLADAARFAEAEAVVSRAAPHLQKVLASALAAGGWFGESHESEALKAATTPDEDERIAAVRTLLAEEARMGMMVGVAVGWALNGELGSGPAVGSAQDQIEPTAETET